MIDTLFVYGTLRPGCGAFHVVEADVVESFEGVLPGHRLMGLDRPYPWCVASSDPATDVHGTVLRLSDPSGVLSRLDRYERADVPDPEYRRAIRPVSVRGDVMECWVYLGRRVPESAVEVPGGDWRRT